MTVPDGLRAAAARAVAAANPGNPNGLRRHAVKLLRDAHGASLPLRDYIDAVEAAIAERTSVAALGRFCHTQRPGAWAYQLPNGHQVSVIVDPHPDRPFRFEVIVDDGQPHPGRTTDQVEAILAATANLSPLPKPKDR